MSFMYCLIHLSLSSDTNEPPLLPAVRRLSEVTSNQMYKSSDWKLRYANKKLDDASNPQEHRGLEQW